MKWIGVNGILIALIISITSRISHAIITKELESGISAVFNNDDHTIRLLGEDNNCIFEINNIRGMAIHPNKNAIMMRENDGIQLKTIVKQNDRWHEINTPKIPIDSEGTSCASRLFRNCNIFIIMLPNAVEIYEFADFAWNLLCKVESAIEIQEIKNLSDSKIIIAAKFVKNSKNFIKEFEYDRNNQTLTER